jgi:hypothetical protein
MSALKADVVESASAAQAATASLFIEILLAFVR